MSGEAADDQRMSRRQFGVATAALATAVGAGAVFGLRGDGDNTEVVAFELRHSPDHYVTMTRGAEFRVAVHESATRNIVEQFNGVTARTVMGLESAYFTLTEIEPHVAA